MSDTAENQQLEKRKRGRPKKNANSSSASNNNSQGISITMQEKLQIAENLNTQNGINPSNQNSAQDWAKELEGDSSLPHTELLQSNPDENKPVNTTAISTNTNNTVIHQEKLVKTPTTIHIVDGEKGGAGKSFVSRGLIEYCASIKHKVAIVDADKSNKDISQIYNNVHSAFFSDDDKKANQADHIFDLAFEKSVIVNLPALCTSGKFIIIFRSGSWSNCRNFNTSLDCRNVKWWIYKSAVQYFDMG